LLSYANRWQQALKLTLGATQLTLPASESLPLSFSDTIPRCRLRCTSGRTATQLAITRTWRTPAWENHNIGKISHVCTGRWSTLPAWSDSGRIKWQYYRGRDLVSAGKLVREFCRSYPGPPGYRQDWTGRWSLAPWFYLRSSRNQYRQWHYSYRWLAPISRE